MTAFTSHRFCENIRFWKHSLFLSHFYWIVIIQHIKCRFTENCQLFSTIMWNMRRLVNGHWLGTIYLGSVNYWTTLQSVQSPEFFYRTAQTYCVVALWNMFKFYCLSFKQQFNLSDSEIRFHTCSFYPTIKCSHRMVSDERRRYLPSSVNDEISPNEFCPQLSASWQADGPRTHTPRRCLAGNTVNQFREGQRGFSSR